MAASHVQRATEGEIRGPDHTHTCTGTQQMFTTIWSFARLSLCPFLWLKVETPPHAPPTSATPQGLVSWFVAAAVLDQTGTFSFKVTFPLISPVLFCFSQGVAFVTRVAYIYFGWFAWELCFFMCLVCLITYQGLESK